MSFPRYPKYKDSGVEWLGEVPEHWEVASLKRGFRVTLGKMLQTEANGPDDELLPYLRAANIRWSGVDTSDVKRMWFSAADKKQLCLQEGDLLVSEGGDVGRSCIWAAEVPNCGFQNSVNRIRAIGGQSTRYLCYWMSTLKSKGYVDVLCNKSTIAHFTAEKVSSVPIPMPSIPEQAAIAIFLDRETTKIDALIAEQQRLIELLQEKRQAVISHAVTKGLNPDAPMKESGIEWLGEVPGHWGVTRISRYATVGNGSTPSRDNQDYWRDGDIPWLSSGEVNQLHVTAASEFVTAQAIEECSLTVLPKGTVLVGMVGQGKTRGLSALLRIEAAINQNLAGIVTTSRLKPEYLHFVFQAMYEYLREYGRGGNQAALNCEILSAAIIPLPPYDEQEAVCVHLANACDQQDSLLTATHRTISLLQERRSALISAAVTGQIDVRGFAGAEAA